METPGWPGVVGGWGVWCLLPRRVAPGTCPAEERQEQLWRLGFPVGFSVVPAWVLGHSGALSFRIPRNTSYQEVRHYLLRFPAPRKKRPALFFTLFVSFLAALGLCCFCAGFLQLQ